MTPVDRAAYYHDEEYGDIYDRYEYSEFEYGLSFTRQLDSFFGTKLAENAGVVQAFGWLGQTTSLDPAMQLELAWADAKIIGRSWLYTGKGIFGFFYRGEDGQNALIADVAWATAITVFHIALITWRLAVMVPLGIAYQVLKGFAGMITKIGDAIGGDVGKAISWVGNFSTRLIVGVGQVVQFLTTIASAGVMIAAGVAAAITGGLVYAVGWVTKGIVKEAGKHIKKAGKWVKKRLGCFITTACLLSNGANKKELDEFRAFRDGWFANTPGGDALIQVYYDVAPQIVTEIENSPDRLKIWRVVYARWVRRFLVAIRLNNRTAAISIYIDMIRILATMVSESSGSVQKHVASAKSP